VACGAAPVGSSIGELLLVASEKGLLQDFDLPLDERGSAFQLRAWAALRALPLRHHLHRQRQQPQHDRDPRATAS